MSDIWSRDQVELILKCLLFRLQTAPEKLQLKREGRELKVNNLSGRNPSDRRIYIVIKDDNWLYISLNEQSGSYSPSFWGDGSIKKLMNEIRRSIKKLMNEIRQKGVVERVATDAALRDCFPEAIDMEFEKFFLEKNK